MWNVRAALISLVLSLAFGCTKAQVGVFAMSGPSHPAAMMSTAGPALYWDSHGNPVTKPFFGQVTFPIPVTVQIVDQYGNPVPSPSPVMVSFGSYGLGSVNPINVTTDQNGMATTMYFPSSLIETAIVTVSSQFNPNWTNVLVEVQPKPASQFKIGTVTGSVSTGDMFRGLLYAADMYGNITPAYVGNPIMTFGPTAASVTIPFAAADAGKKVFSLAPVGVGTGTLSVTDGSSIGSFPGADSAAPSAGTIDNFTTAGLWVTTSNWSLGTVPSTLQQANMTVGGTITAAAVAQRMTIAAGNTVTNNSTLSIYGSDLTANGTFNGGSGTLNFNVTGWTHTQEIFVNGSPLSVGTLTGGGTGGITFSPTGITSIAALATSANVPIYINGYVMVNNPITLATNASIVINPGGTLDASGGINATAAGSRVVVLGGGTLLLANGQTLSIGNTGSLITAGTATQRVTVDVDSGTGTYYVQIGSGATISSTFTDFNNTGNPGILVSSSATSVTIDHTHFGNISLGQTAIALGATPVGRTMAYLTFDDSACPGQFVPIDLMALSANNRIYGFNVTANSGADMTHLTNDPNSVMVWDRP